MKSHKSHQRLILQGLINKRTDLGKGCVSPFQGLLLMFYYILSGQEMTMANIRSTKGTFSKRKKQLEKDLEKTIVEACIEAYLESAKAEGVEIEEEDIRTIESKVKERIKKNREEHKTQVKRGRPKGSINFKTLQREWIKEIDKKKK